MDLEALRAEMDAVIDQSLFRDDQHDETAHLLRHPANEAWLSGSLEEARRGEVEEHPLDRS